VATTHKCDVPRVIFCKSQTVLGLCGHLLPKMDHDPGNNQTLQNPRSTDAWQSFLKILICMMFRDNVLANISCPSKLQQTSRTPQDTHRSIGKNIQRLSSISSEHGIMAAATFTLHQRKESSAQCYNGYIQTSIKIRVIDNL
jgi:hypothetical protein